MCFSMNPNSTAPVISNSGVDLRYFRPRPILSEEGKVNGYDGKMYNVKVFSKQSLHNRTQLRGGGKDRYVPVREEAIVKLAAEILKKFPYQAYTYVYFVSDTLNGVGEFDKSNPYRITKNPEGNIHVQQKSWTTYSQDEDSLREQGYAKISLIFYCGNSNKVKIKKGNLNISQADLESL